MTSEKARLLGAPSRVPGLRERKRSATRRELIQAGRKLFSTDGLYDSRIEDITQHAGIAKGTLYLYFRNKEDLALAVVGSVFEELHQRIVARLEGRQALAGLAAEAFAAHLEFFEQNPDLMRILHQVRGVLKFDRPRWRPLRDQLRRHIDFVAAALARGEAAALSLARRRELAIFLYGCASGTSSVLVSTYPGSAPLGAWSRRWAAGIARAVVEVAHEQVSKRSDRRKKRS